MDKNSDERNTATDARGTEEGNFIDIDVVEKARQHQEESQFNVNVVVEETDERCDSETLSVRSLPAYMPEPGPSNEQTGQYEEQRIETVEWREYTMFLDDLQTMVKHKRLEKEAKLMPCSQTAFRVPPRRAISVGDDLHFRTYKNWPKVRMPPSLNRRSFSCSTSTLLSQRKCPLTTSQIWTLACLSFLSFTSFASVSIIAPFFPHEASLKGMTESVSGMVFAVYGLTLMIMSPLIGKILPHIGVKFALISGVVVAGLSNIIFGLLDRVDDYLMFTAYCFIVRIFEALGAASLSTSSYAYIMKIFPNSIGTAFGITETCVGLGMSLGPAIGGGLYAIGGYSLPFFVLGLVVLINVPVCWYLLAAKEGFDECESSSSDSSTIRLTYLKLISIPEVIVVCCVIVVVSQSVGFLDPTVEPHLRQFDIGAEFVGLVFLLLSAIYAICSPITGYIAGKTEKKLLIMLVGLLLTAFSLIIIGPTYFIPIDPNVYITTFAMGFLGMSTAFALIPTFETILVTSMKRGYCDDINTYSLVSGLWSSMYALGEVTGPFMGGFFLESFGFESAATIMGGFALAAAFFVAVVSCYTKKHQTFDELDASQGDQKSAKQSPATKADSGIIEFDNLSRCAFAAHSRTSQETMTTCRPLEYSLPPSRTCRHGSESSHLLEYRSHERLYGSHLADSFQNSV